MSAIDQTDWRHALVVQHPEIKEPQELREARVLRTLDAFLRVNGDEIDETVLAKCQKSVNVRLLTIMDELRDATP